MTKRKEYFQQITKEDLLKAGFKRVGTDGGHPYADAINMKGIEIDENFVCILKLYEYNFSQFDTILYNISYQMEFGLLVNNVGRVDVCVDILETDTLDSTLTKFHHLIGLMRRT